jgi:hypothetical protein
MPATPTTRPAPERHLASCRSTAFLVAPAVSVLAPVKPSTRPVAPAPAPAPSARPSAATAPGNTAAAAPLAEAPADWQLLDPATDRVPGTAARRAAQELLRGRKPERTVVVAVIDGGVDTAHVTCANL